MATSASVNGKRVIVQKITCTLPGFEAVEITYNLMATEGEADAFIKRMGGDGSAAPVVVSVEGWDTAAYGADPWNKDKAPSVFRAWATRVGWGVALKAFITDPNF